MDFNSKDTALVVTDPQNDFLSPDGVTWGLVGGSVEENKTVEHIGQLFKAAKDKGYDVFISPHYYYPTDKGWQFGGTVENMMHEINMFNRKGALTTDGFSGSGWAMPATEATSSPFGARYGAANHSPTPITATTTITAVPATNRLVDRRPATTRRSPSPMTR